VVLWPTPVNSKAQASDILHTESFKVSAQKFSMASQLIMAFMESSTSAYFFFEVYNINGIHIAQDLSKEGVVEFKCDYCRGPALRRPDLYGITLNVTGVVS
jgi:hypothetical protein